MKLSKHIQEDASHNASQTLIDTRYNTGRRLNTTEIENIAQEKAESFYQTGTLQQWFKTVPISTLGNKEDIITAYTEHFIQTFQILYEQFGHMTRQGELNDLRRSLGIPEEPLNEG